MKTIEIISGEQKAQFTTKSVTVDGREFFYAKMSNVAHDAAGRSYTFTYDGEVKTLSYEARDEKVLRAIFTQVRDLEAKKAAAAEAKNTAAGKSSQEPAATSMPQPETAQAAKPETAQAVKPETAQTAETPAETEAAQPAVQSAAKEKSAAKENAKSEKERRKAEKQAEKEKRKAEKAARKSEAAAPSEAEGEQTVPEDPEKKEKMKKSLVVFAIVLAAFLLLGILYFFLFGTSSDPSFMSPNATESQQYDDIDQLINDLQ